MGLGERHRVKRERGRGREREREQVRTDKQIETINRQQRKREGWREVKKKQSERRKGSEAG